MEHQTLVFHAPATAVEAVTAETRGLTTAFAGRLFIEVITSLTRRISPSAVLVISSTLHCLSAGDVQAIKQHRNAGGPVLVMIPEASGPQLSEPALGLLREYGVASVCRDPVISSVYTPGLYHPTHLLLSAASFVSSQLLTKIEKAKGGATASDVFLVYPNGCSFTVSSAAVPILSSGDGGYPSNQPVAVVHREHPNSPSYGRCVILGTAQMCSPAFISKFDNRHLFEVLLQYLDRNADAPVFSQAATATDSLIGGGDEVFIPDTQTAALNMRTCLHAPDPLPEDFTRLLDTVATANPNVLPQVSALYERMGFSRSEPTLKLVNPNFEKPTPPLIPAVHFPVLPDPPGEPLLELFDLDTELASEQARLNKLAHKCDDEDVDLFVQQAGELVNLTGSPKEILFQILSATIRFKKGESS
ncbi:IFT complex B [Giardia muris]|uniref:IFT complex B n=1 Tax=Giardia muris TaxID=5742 RepID=A0A4Z1T0R3_GIAMU|nr:IFT complex B [Giardia muris]|eukprot:TNJ30565.1 IFT complex B [Giardia muris]